MDLVAIFNFVFQIDANFILFMGINLRKHIIPDKTGCELISGNASRSMAPVVTGRTARGRRLAPPTKLPADTSSSAATLRGKRSKSKSYFLMECIPFS